RARVEPIYETAQGWDAVTAGARSWAQLPANAIKYVRRIEELIGTPVALLSTSPDRADTITVRDPFFGYCPDSKIRKIAISTPGEFQNHRDTSNPLIPSVVLVSKFARSR